MADPDWHDWGARFRHLRKQIERLFPDDNVSGVGLFLLQPGQEHPMHRDEQPPNWLTRVHVPVVTNPLATATTDDGTIHMQAGTAYRFNTRENHAVRNDGLTPRVHFVCDIVKG